jgi:hypothetical protein
LVDVLFEPVELCRPVHEELFDVWKVRVPFAFVQTALSS